jgi:uncharacterized protein (DUF4415 family)
METATWHPCPQEEPNEAPIVIDWLERFAVGHTEHQPLILISLSQHQPVLRLSGLLPLQIVGDISWNWDGMPRLFGLWLLKDQPRPGDPKIRLHVYIYVCTVGIWISNGIPIKQSRICASMVSISPMRWACLRMNTRSGVKILMHRVSNALSPLGWTSWVGSWWLFIPTAASASGPFLRAGQPGVSERAMNEEDRDIEMRDEYDFTDAIQGPVIPTASGKTRITIRLDNDILDWFRTQVHQQGGGNYQTLINRALREYMQSGEGRPISRRERETVLAFLPEDIEPIVKMITELHSALVHAEPSLEEQLRRVIREELERAS